jgi:transposase
MYFEAHYEKFNKPKDFRKAAMSTLRYISTRVVNGEKVTIPIFGWEELEQDEAKAIINIRSEVWPRRFWRMIISPDIQEENLKKDLDLWKLARDTIEYIKGIDKNVEFIFAEHNDTNIPHIQGLVFFNGKLKKKDLKLMKTLARKYALSQQLDREPAKKFLRRLEKISQKYRFKHKFMQRHSGMEGGRARYRPRRMRKPRQPTIPCPFGGMHSAVKFKDEEKYYCSIHKKVYEWEQGLSL